MSKVYKYEQMYYNGTDYDTLLPKSAYSVSVPINTSAWNASTKTATVTVPSVGANDNIIVTYSPSSHDVYLSCGVYCSSQGDKNLTFKCNKVPSSLIIANVLIL